MAQSFTVKLTGGAHGPVPLKQKVRWFWNYFFIHHAVRIIREKWFKALLLALGAFLLILVRSLFQSFGVSLGYLYVILIYFSGLWFGVTGGIAMALISLNIFLIEAGLFSQWPFRDLVLGGILFRTLSYLFTGAMIGYLAGRERRIRGQLREAAYFDELTGCVNYRWLAHILKNELIRAKRYYTQLTVIMLDLDDFKTVNDEHGHQTGNEILKVFASLLMKNVRNIDVVGRFGGDEFLVILPESTAYQAGCILRRLQHKIKTGQFHLPSVKRNMAPFLNFSAGVASYPNSGSENVEDLIRLADRSLYEAKKQGGHRIILEKRESRRISYPSGVKLEIFDPRNKELRRAIKLCDISRKGMLFLFPRDIGRRQVKCRVHFPEDRSPVEISCRIVHREKVRLNQYRIGVCFIRVPVHYEEKVEQVTELNR